MLLHRNLALWPARGLALLSAALLLGWSGAAGAATDYFYTDYSGTSYDFTGLKETVQTADDEASPLFEAPTGSGDQLLFSPSSFDASSSSGSGIDSTHSTFNATITRTGAAFVDLIAITEAGDLTLSDFPPGSGTAATGVLASLAGTIQVTNALNPLDIGTLITFGGIGSDFVTSFNGGAQSGSFFQGLQPGGTFAWDASVVIDIASIVSGVTEVEIQINNILQANSESGTTASIQKKAVSGPRITVIPEPGTLALVAPGLVALAIRARRRRA